MRTATGLHTAAPQAAAVKYPLFLFVPEAIGVEWLQAVFFIWDNIPKIYTSIRINYILLVIFSAIALWIYAQITLKQPFHGLCNAFPAYFFKVGGMNGSIQQSVFDPTGKVYFKLRQ